ncbi:MAG: SpoIIE family protein phosphatase [Terracidiphilus sp.]
MKRHALLLTMLAMAVCLFAPAQSFDLTNGRVLVASLDGLWRFHTGDDPAWASPSFDDSQWQLLRSDEDWSSQGYNGYGGLAWYRFQVTVPSGLDDVSLMLPTIRTCYEVYADGQLIGTYGKMPPNQLGYNGGGPQVYKLPAGSHSDRRIEVALRVWHFPGWAGFIGGGIASGGALIGDSGEIQSRISAIRAQRLWNSSADEILALLETLSGLGSLALFLLRRKDQEYLWFGLVMLFNPVGNWIALFMTTQIWSLQWRDVLAGTTHLFAWLAVPIFYLHILKPKRTWLFDFGLASIVATLVVLLAYSFFGVTRHIWLINLAAFVLGLPATYWIVKVILVKSREGSPDARLLLAPQLLYTSLFLVSSAATVSYQIGWQHSFFGEILLTNTPFPIRLDQVADALFPLAVFGILVLRFTRTRSEEERYAGEVQAARNVQQYLIPELLPNTPGLSIESEYRPAREVGGDFFQVLPDTADDSVLIIVGDVAGHGMEAGMLATLIVGAIRTAAEFTIEPGSMLALLNKRMQGRGLATCLALRVEKNGSAALANAGHLPPYLNGKELAIEGALPLGAVQGIDFPVLHFRLGKGDTLMLMTDGVAEAQNAGGRLFGFDRIAEMLRKGAAASALASAAQAFGQEDDITVLTVERIIA